MRTLLLSTLLLSVVLVSALRTLNSAEELQKTGFGLVPPHHGLKLLKWYVKTCVDNHRKSQCDILKGEFGFHLYHNYEKILPKVRSQGNYFSVGNLKLKKAKELPIDVKMNYTSNNLQSNIDRVVVEYNPEKNFIKSIYISEHYKKNRTYMIGKRLVALLRKSASYFTIEM